MPRKIESVNDSKSSLVIRVCASSAGKSVANLWRRSKIYNRESCSLDTNEHNKAAAHNYKDWRTFFASRGSLEPSRFTTWIDSFSEASLTRPTPNREEVSSGGVFIWVDPPTIDFANRDAGLLSVERFVDGCSVELAKWALEATAARMNANEFGNRRKGFIIGRSFFRSPRSLEFCSSVFFFSFRWRLRYWITGWRIYQGCFLVESKDLVDGRLLSNVKASFDHQFAICQLSKLMKSIKCHTIAPIERVHSEWSGWEPVRQKIIIASKKTSSCSTIVPIKHL